MVLFLEKGRQVHTGTALLALIWYLWGLAMTFGTNFMKTFSFFTFWKHRGGSIAKIGTV